MTPTLDDVERIGLGSGSPEGQNSAYLVGNHAVVDPGPPSDEAWADLRDGLERAGVSLSDLEYVLVTHWHVDHAGLAPRLAEAAGATIAMGAGDASLVADYETERRRRLERDRETMRRWGVPDAAAESVIEGDTPSAMPDSVPVEGLADGDAVAGLEAVWTPGHTLGHTAFAGDGFLLVGDAVLPTYTPNVGGSDTRTLAPDEPVVGPSLESDPLAAYRETLEALADRPERLLPGHGTRIRADRIDDILAHQDERSRRVRSALEDRVRDAGEGATPWSVATDLFGDLEGVHVKFGAGEVAAHCRRLERAGAVERVRDDPLAYAPFE